MPLFYQQHIDEHSRLAVWHIQEPEAFFLEKVPVSRQMTHPQKRLQHLAGRYLLQHLFADFPLALIQVADTRKPYLPEESHHFSISHCGQFAAALVSTTHRVGIDIEEPGPRLLTIRHKFTTPAEAALVDDAPDDAGQLRRLTKIWSAKESMFKWYSHGAVDFRGHMEVLQIDFDAATTGVMQASFHKHEPIALTLGFRYWESLVLSWLVY